MAAEKPQKLYLTYTDDLRTYAESAIAVAKAAGWTVADGPGYPNRLETAKACDALLLISAYTYGHDEAGQGIQELEWDAMLKARKPVRALLPDESVSWIPPTAMEAWDHPNRLKPLRAFFEKVKTSQRFGYFQPATIGAAVSAQLEMLEGEVAEEASVFVVWDFELLDVDLILTSLERQPPEGFRFQIPRRESGSGGDILLNTVLPGIRDHDRVLVVTDRPNANVGFEAGLALGFRKPTCLVCFGSSVPAWLQKSLFRGFNVEAIENLTQLRSYIKNESKWYKPKEAGAVPESGATLFLSSRHAGAALRELEGDTTEHWDRPPEGSNFNEAGERLAGVAQIVWAITPFAEGSDVRDGADNAANGVLAGWFLARTFHGSHKGSSDRLTVIRHEKTRPVTDVFVQEKVFQNINQFIDLLKKVPDRRLPMTVNLGERNFGNSQYQLVKVPVQTREGKTIWAGRYPVTNQQYRQFCQATGYALPKHLQAAKEPDDAPVVNVSVTDAERFCSWAMLELPSADEWKQLFRAGAESTYWWGDDPTVVRIVAWCRENSDDRIHPVGLQKPNTWGLYDLLGNVWEWTKRYVLTSEAPYSGAVIELPKSDALGGAYNTPLSRLHVPQVALNPDDTNPYTGFRCIVCE